MATYIFDFDGTIADSFSLACDVFLKQSKYLGCKQLTPRELLPLKELHAREVLKYLGIPWWRTASFVRKLRQIGTERVNEIKLFPEWPVILKRLKENKHTLAIVSSNTHNTIEMILKKYDLYFLFDFIVCDQSLFNKKRCLNHFINKQRLNRSDTYYIGDEVRDIEAAQSNKIHAIAVCWGFNSTERLRQAKPDQLILSIEQLKNW